MSEAADMVREFHEVFGAPIGYLDTPGLRSNRLKLIAEEFDELRDELSPWILNGPRTKVAKEMADLVYVLHGTALALWIDLDEAIRLVHASNMTKLDEDGQVIYREDGKVLKSSLYREPDMEGAVK